MGKYIPPDACVANSDGSYDSLIMDVFKNPTPKEVAITLQVINYKALKNSNSYTKEKALKVIDELNTFLDNDIMYSDLLLLINEKVLSVNAEINMALLIFSPQLAELNKMISISVCDKAMLKKHFNDQKLMVLSIDQ
jgi:hypothetical protein